MSIFNLNKNYKAKVGLISYEGWQILKDQNKRKELRSIIEDYHKKGIWDYERIYNLTTKNTYEKEN